MDGPGGDVRFAVVGFVAECSTHRYLLIPIPPRSSPLGCNHTR